jgi:RNA methyltransferase, TrmH family
VAGPAPELTSTRSDRVARVRRLATRASRDRDGRFVAEGPQAVREALLAPSPVETLYATPEAYRRYPDLVADRAGSRVVTVTDDVLAAMSHTVHPQGLLAVCRRLDVPLEQVAQARPRLVAVLAEIRDPGNAGTVLRTADAAGADAVVLTAGSVDPYNPKVVRATAGSLFHLPVVWGPEPDAAVASLRAAGLRVLAADGSGDVDLFAAADDGVLAGPTAWLFGNEAWGLPDPVRALADHVVRIPIRGRAESLNLAAAAAVCLYASARAHEGAPA